MFAARDHRSCRNDGIALDSRAFEHDHVRAAQDIALQQHGLGRSADWKSAIQQVGNLRYVRGGGAVGWPDEPEPPDAGCYQI